MGQDSLGWPPQGSGIWNYNLKSESELARQEVEEGVAGRGTSMCKSPEAVRLGLVEEAQDQHCGSTERGAKNMGWEWRGIDGQVRTYKAW